MRKHRIGCLPVVQDGHIVAVVTEEDFVGIAGKVLEEAASSLDVTLGVPSDVAGGVDEGDPF
jgi:CBS domain-containing protein